MISDSPTLPSFLFGAGVVMIHTLTIDRGISRDLFLPLPHCKLIVEATLPSISVQFGFSPAIHCSERMLLITFFINLFIFSTEPWSLGRRGHPVTVRIFGFKSQRNFRIDFPTNSLPLLVWKMRGYPITPKISCRQYATRDGCFLGNVQS